MFSFNLLTSSAIALILVSFLDCASADKTGPHRYENMSTSSQVRKHDHKPYFRGNEDDESREISDLLGRISLHPRILSPWNQTCFDSKFKILDSGCYDKHTSCGFYSSISTLPQARNVYDCHSRPLSDAMEQHFGSYNAEYFLGRKMNSFYAYENRMCNAANSTHKLSKNDVIFSMAEHYNCDKLAVNLRNIRVTGCHAEVVLLRNDPYSCPEIANSCGKVTIVPYKEFISGGASDDGEVIKFFG